MKALSNAMKESVFCVIVVRAVKKMVWLEFERSSKLARILLAKSVELGGVGVPSSVMV
jgi:hypothetical protein